ncbi:MAG: hypothetical protein ACOH12_15710 [Parvibaculaceae bacterium]
MDNGTIKHLVLVAAIGFAATGPAFAQSFPWQPVSPPVYSPPVSPPPAKLPKAHAPTHIVPGHKSEYGYVAPYESDGPVAPLPGPNGASRGWVPGHHDAKGAWVPGHPQ